MHRTEIHSKLVAIMRERLATNLKQLPAVADTWGLQPHGQQELTSPPPPSHFALTNSKQLRILSQVGCNVMVLCGLDGKQLTCLQSPTPQAAVVPPPGGCYPLALAAFAAAASSDLVTAATQTWGVLYSCCTAAVP